MCILLAKENALAMQSISTQTLLLRMVKNCAQRHEADMDFGEPQSILKDESAVIAQDMSPDMRFPIPSSGKD